MPKDDHHRQKSKRSHDDSRLHDREELCTIKPENPDHSPHRRSSPHDHKSHSRKRRNSGHKADSPTTPPYGRRRRLREPQVIKQEEGQRRGRLHSPVLIKDEDRRNNSQMNSNRQDHDRDFKGNLSQSGLLGKDDGAPVAKQRANFGLSGKLAEDTNTYKGVVIKYNEPEDARKPTEHWRLYVFKGTETLPILHIHRQSGFLIGRDRKIADLPMDHPSISKQHAVLQYRLVRGLVRLYLIDLESANGTYLNNQRIEPRRYYELIEKDVLKFGYSSREYVVMTPNLDDNDDDDETPQAPDETVS